MSKDCIIEYSACILLNILGPLMRSLPLNAGLFIGRRLGELFYYLDFKHKAIAYANIKTALGKELSPCALSLLTKDFYRAFGQNLIEIFFIPLVDKDYLKKYIQIEGLEHIEEGFRRGRGIIFLGIHEGSWELSNIISAQLGFTFRLFIRQQRYVRLNNLLNKYRVQKGCRIIQKGNQLRQLIEALKNNEAVGMTADQGGRDGLLVDFFGKEASMPLGAVRLALKYGSTIIPVYYFRVKGPYLKVIIHPPVRLQKSGDEKRDILRNLQEIVRLFENRIREYPQEYLWTYKIWKYGRKRNILILSDGKKGHLRQSEAVQEIVRSCAEEKGLSLEVKTVEVKFKHKISHQLLALSSFFFGRYYWQGCLRCLKSFLKRDTYDTLLSLKPDMIISGGSSLAAVNFTLSRENLAKSVVLMRPSILSTRRFDLVIMPKHDSPVKRRNVLVTDGALSPVDHRSLQEEAKLLRAKVQHIENKNVLGLLIGGDSKDFRLKPDLIRQVVFGLKVALEEQDAELLASTSRRTSSEIEDILKKELGAYPRCKFLVIASEDNPPFTIGGILGLSKIIVVSPESISMISEAVNSARPVVVFDTPGLGKRHRRFLEHFAGNKYIRLVRPEDLGGALRGILQNEPEVYPLKDNLRIRQAIEGIL